MKKLFYILILITGVANAQIVNIPDPNFKAMLLSSNSTNQIASNGSTFSYTIDTNGDGEIQESEASVITDLFIRDNQSIISMEGISSFTNLTYLEITNLSSLTSLDLSNLSNLYEVRLWDLTSLTSVNFDGCSSLFWLEFRRVNNLTSLDLTGNSSINWLFVNEFSNDSLIDLNVLNLTGCTGLRYLYIVNTTLATLNVSQCINLEDLTFRGNFVVNLDISGLQNLRFVKISGISNLDTNPMQSINLNGCTNLSAVDITSLHQLQSIYIKNGLLDDSLSFVGTPSLTYICGDEIEHDYLQSYLNVFGAPFAFATSYCTFTPGGNYNTIVGQVQLDGDNNGCDVNDGGLQNVRINITDGTETGATFSNANGGYTFYTQALNQELSVATENPTWFTVSPATASVSFTDINNNQILQNFCVTSNGVHDDVEVVIVPTIPARPGFDATYKIVYRNKGNTIAAMNSGISLSFNDDLMDFLSSTQTVVAQDIGFLAWDVTSLLPFESKSFEVVFNINAPTDQIPVNNDDVLTFTSIINVSNNDENTADNTFVLNQTVVGSYDPNDITCLEGDIVSPTEIGEYLHHNIRFENTGTFYAENIVVKTEINPAEFDINTLQLLNASHPVDARIRGNIIEFIFQGIYLDTGGHGNVLLKLKTKPTLQTGDLVKNKANIYFDYNFPILTNDAETVFQSLSNPDFEVDNSVKIYPNPSNAVVNIKSDFNIKSIQLYDVQGRILQTNIVEENTTSLDITSKSKGIYFLKVITDKGIKVEKLVKE